MRAVFFKKGNRFFSWRHGVSIPFVGCSLIIKKEMYVVESVTFNYDDDEILIGVI